MIVGGIAGQDTVLNSAEIYDPQAQAFSPATNTMKTPRGLAILKLLPDGKVQVIGGDSEFSVEIYDPQDGLFNALATMPPTPDLLVDTFNTESRAALISPIIAQHPTLQGLLGSEELGYLDRADQSITELPQLNQALVAGGVTDAGQVLSSAFIVKSSPATITTDKTDYAPGEIVTITGTGWQPGEEVGIILTEHPDEYPDIKLLAVADQQGKFVTADFAPQLIDLDRTFTLTAVGLTSGFVAQTAFTDGNLQSVSLAQSSVTVTQGDTAQYTVNVTMGGNTNACTVTLSITTALPAGAVASFSTPNPTTLNPGNVNFSRTLNITTAGVTPNTYSFTAQATRGADCQGSGNPTTNGTLVVQAAGTAPTITSANSTTFTVGAAGSFTVTTTGTPTPALTTSGTLPSGVTFTDNGDGTATLGGTPALGTVGSYPITITANNGISPNATQNFTLTVQKANQTITFGALGNKTYGDADFTVSATASSGLAVSFSSQTLLTCSTSGINGSTVTILAAGSCTVRASQAGNSNYNAAPNVDQSFTINKRNATWTTNPNSKTYGNADPVPLTTGSGDFLVADGVTATYSRVAGETVAGSPYPITATLSAAAGVLDNYNITNNGADFTINKRPITVTADAKSKIYGEADPALTYQVTSGSLAFSDAFTGVLSRVPGELVGTYAIQQNTLSISNIGNYNLTYVGANLTITTGFAYSGFYSPIGGSVEYGSGGTYANPVRSFKLGSTIPVKFGATWLNGGAPLITGIHTLQAIKYSNAATIEGTPIDATPTDSATTGNQFRLTGTDWHFNLSTKGNGFTDGTWLLRATLVDGSQYTVWIALKK